ncbi:hypothetical protein Mycsm_01581 [Mycobacterium sp. JS623]|nr:hypothetical protein Mycsm_01581 [Mycobacterium sp. JS623]
MRLGCVKDHASEGARGHYRGLDDIKLSFSELNRDPVKALADVLTGVYETILRNGTLPRPDVDVPLPARTALAL